MSDSKPDKALLDAVWKHFQYLGLGGPTVAQTQQVIDGLREHGFIKSDALITAEQLHTAASLAAQARGFDDLGVSTAAVEEFIALSEFHPPMDATSLAYGIVVGILAVKVRDSERNDDNG